MSFRRYKRPKRNSLICSQMLNNSRPKSEQILNVYLRRKTVLKKYFLLNFQPIIFRKRKKSNPSINSFRHLTCKNWISGAKSKPIISRSGPSLMKNWKFSVLFTWKKTSKRSASFWTHCSITSKRMISKFLSAKALNSQLNPLAPLPSSLMALITYQFLTILSICRWNSWTRGLSEKSLPWCKTFHKQ